MSTFFYDSYAIIEYLKDNPSFVGYFEDYSGIITIFNVVEVYYSLLNEQGEEKANTVLDVLSPLIVEPTKDTIKQAMIFRKKHKKRKISYADCIGHQIALDRNIRFLTGDNQFRDFPNVEFVK
jgi:predicted nucleic acid-binding protein